MASAQKIDHVRYVIVENIRAPRLKGITTPDFVEFRDERELYERRMAAINSDSPTRIQLASYLDSIPRHLVRDLMLTGMLKVRNIEDVTEQELRACVEYKVKVSITENELPIIEHRLKDVKMRAPTGSETFEDQILDLFSQYTATLHKWGYDEFIDKKPDVASKHIVDRFVGEMAILSHRLKDSIETLDSFQLFMSHVILCARMWDREQDVRARHLYFCCAPLHALGLRQEATENSIKRRKRSTDNRKR